MEGLQAGDKIKYVGESNRVFTKGKIYTVQEDEDINFLFIIGNEEWIAEKINPNDFVKIEKSKSTESIKYPFKLVKHHDFLWKVVNNKDSKVVGYIKYYRNSNCYNFLNLYSYTPTMSFSKSTLQECRKFILSFYEEILKDAYNENLKIKIMFESNNFILPIKGFINEDENKNWSGCNTNFTIFKLSELDYIHSKIKNITDTEKLNIINSYQNSLLNTFNIDDIKDLKLSFLILHIEDKN
ncbi:MAG: hypothetical protein [Bacteriophage sp.]|nr:MAG: hypothetical protein [Bacteriophage sp.]